MIELKSTPEPLNGNGERESQIEKPSQRKIREINEVEEGRRENGKPGQFVFLKKRIQ